MAINNALMMSSLELQEVLVDESGNPLAGGIVTLTQDTSRLTLKNWYYQTGSPGSYSFVALSNPLTLSAAGTVQDPSGNDTVPFFYPYDESVVSDNPPIQKYYITVTDSSGNPRFDRQNFPLNVPSAESISQPTIENIIVNGEFWRNIGTLTNPFLTTNTGPITIVPSQHDGIRMPDMQFMVTSTGATETLSFPTFDTSNQVLPGDVRPEYYLDFNCTNAGIGTETEKIIQIPLSTHLLTLAGLQDCAFTFQAKADTATNLGVKIIADYGTGGPPAVVQDFGVFQVQTEWAKKGIGFDFQDIDFASISAAGDDAWYIQFIFPNTEIHIQLAKPSLYLSTTIPTNDFSTYDEINTVISSPRTGDIRSSLNAFYPYGWVPMNNGTIGNATTILSSNATTRANKDTWQLFNLIWSLAQPYDLGGGTPFNPIAQLYDDTGAVLVNYGVSAYADFVTNNRQLALTKMLGNVIMGTVPVAALLNYKQAFTAANLAGFLRITIPTAINLFNGQPIVFTATAPAILPTGLVANRVYYVADISGLAFYVAETFAQAMAARNVLAGNVVAWTAVGTPPYDVVFNLTGSSTGEYGHVQAIAELALHDHPGSTVAAGVGAGNTAFGEQLATSTHPVTVAPQGQSLAFNIVQPSSLYNIFIKL